MSKSNIEWTTETWNPIVGCSIVSPGCTNCYAMAMASRIEAMNTEARETERNSGKRRPIAKQYDGTTRKVNGHTVWTGKVAMAGDNVLLQPLKRKKPTTYFVNSMGDLFHEDVPDEWIDIVFAVMALCPQHTFQVLTKRARRMRDYFLKRQARDIHPLEDRELAIDRAMNALAPAHWCKRELHDYSEEGLPLPNVWLGVSTERQQEADERIPLLLDTPAAVRFISAEPLLGPIDLTQSCAIWWGAPGPGAGPFDMKRRPLLDWVIVGGESGSRARPMHPQWARDLRVQCEAAGVPFFFKQWGGWIPGAQAAHMSESDLAEYQMQDVVTPGRNSPVGSYCYKVGKKRAGRALDGIEYNEMPEGAR